MTPILAKQHAVSCNSGLLKARVLDQVPFVVPVFRNEVTHHVEGGNHIVSRGATNYYIVKLVFGNQCKLTLTLCGCKVVSVHYDGNSECYTRASGFSWTVFCRRIETRSHLPLKCWRQGNPVDRFMASMNSPQAGRATSDTANLAVVKACRCLRYDM